MQDNSAASAASPSAAQAPAPAWTVARIRAIHDLPLPELLYRAQTVHRQHHRPEQVQLCTLLSVKTGGCAEDCSYCPQSSAHDAMDAERFLQVEEVLQSARAAKQAGATRFCMGAAWREIKDGPAFDRVLQMVGGVRELGMEACVTLGMLNQEQAQRLATAGLTAYNHNLDTAAEFCNTSTGVDTSGVYYDSSITATGWPLFEASTLRADLARWANNSTLRRTAVASLASLTSGVVLTRGGGALAGAGGDGPVLYPTAPRLRQRLSR